MFARVCVWVIFSPREFEAPPCNKRAQFRKLKQLGIEEVKGKKDRCGGGRGDPSEGKGACQGQGI